MPDSNNPSPENGEVEDQTGIRKSEHARLRAGQGRPIGIVINDVQRAGPGDVFVQPDDARFVVRGPKGREHVIEGDGEHVTSLRRSEVAHQDRLRDGTIRPATDQDFQRLKAFID